jgi:hypothetical protein
VHVAFSTPGGVRTMEKDEGELIDGRRRRAKRG